MKKMVLIGSFLVLAFPARPQSAEIEQLLLNWEKLTQFKKILQNMYDGYKVLQEGYEAIKNVSQGNFSLHQNFLDALYQVSPTVRQYRKIADIVQYQLRIVKECKGASDQFRADGQFTADEVSYMVKLYKNMLDRSARSLEELALVLTSGQLRMNDDERLAAIDRIYAAVVDQFSFLKTFNSQTALLSLQRARVKGEVEVSRVTNKLR